MIRWAGLLAVAGLVLATGLILHQGLGAIVAALGAAGLGILWSGLFHIVPMALNARAWQILLPGARKPGLAFFTGAVWVREAVNGLLPVARIGGEVASARLLRRRGVRNAPTLASLVVDMTLSILSQALFALLGIALLALRGELGGAWPIALALLAALPLVALLVAVQHLGLFGLLGRIFETVLGDRLAGLLGSAIRLDRAIRQFYRRRDRILACTLWQLAGWVAGAGEIWLALHFLGHPVGLAEAVIVEALIQAVSSAAFLVPGALGVQEGGFLAVGALVGLPADTALALALTRRARDLLLFVPALLAWQAAEGRALWRRARAAG
ncbi:MAG: lysylphosphatidylglycerol synthase domain-containing protein [Dongiaceae bacterium]